jgi:hypothetical protein
MLSGVTDDLPGWIATNADTEWIDADNEPPPLPIISPAAANAKEVYDDDDAAGVAVNVH